MTDKKFYATALGISSPWIVESVDLDMAERKVEIQVALKPSTRWCEDGVQLPIKDYAERRWRHLDTMQLETTIVARVPRVCYPDGTTGVVTVPWAGGGARWTLDFEAFAVLVLKNTNSISEAERLLRISWRSADNIMSRAVERGLGKRVLRGTRRLGIDEKRWKGGRTFATVLNDLGKGRILEVTEGRSAKSGNQAFGVLSSRARKRVSVVAADMSPAYAKSVRESCKNADLVHDRYHIDAMMGKAVDQTRRAENKELLAEGDSTLKGARYHFLYNPENLPGKYVSRFMKLVEQNLKTSKAWFHRLLLKELWECRTREEGEEHFARWFSRAVRSKIAAVVKVARTLRKHRDGILAYFRHRATNALSESMNSRVQALVCNARGFGSFKSFRIRLLFHQGGLELSPR